MKWTGIVKKGDAVRHGILPMVDRDVMAVMSQRVCTTFSMPACLRAALIPIDLDVPRMKSKDGGSSFQIALKGGLSIDGLDVELIFQSRPRSRSPFLRDLTTKVTLLPAGQALDVQNRS